MRIPNLLFVTGVLILLSNCRSPADKITDSFNKINESLQQSNRSIDSTMKNLQLPGFDEKTADSISMILNNATDFLERTKTELQNARGNRLDEAEKLLVKTAKGDTLFNHMMSVYDLGIKYISDSSAKQGYVLFRERNKNIWLEKYFRWVPLIAAQTILSKFQNDCLNIRMQLSGNGINELKKQILNQ